MKRITVLVSCIFFALISSISGYAQGWAWAKSTAGYGGTRPGRAATDPSGNVIVAGEQYIIKYDASGSMLWKKDPSNGFTSSALDVCTDATGNIYVAGSFSITATFGSTTLVNSGSDDIFVAKYDAAGTVQWAKKAGGSDYDNAYGVAVDGSGNVYVAGSFSGTSVSFGSTTVSGVAGSMAMFLVKYSSSGSVTWARAVDNGTFSCRASAISTDNSGNILVTGVFSGSTITFGSVTLSNVASPYPDMFTAKYDGSGTVLWAACGGSDYYDGSWDIAMDAAGNSYVAGTFTGSTMYIGSASLTNAANGSQDAYVVSYDASGNVRWTKRIGGTNSDDIMALTTDASGNLYMAGNFGSSSVSFGTTTLTNTSSGTDIMVAKCNGGGVEQWAVKVGSADDESAYGIASDDGNIFVSGEFGGPSLTFGSNAVTSSGGFNKDIFVAKLNHASGVQGPEQRFVATRLYPNPSRHEMNVEAKYSMKNVAIVDRDGRIVQQHECNSNKVVINTQALPAGLFEVVIDGNEVQTFSKE